MIFSTHAAIQRPSNFFFEKVGQYPLCGTPLDLIRDKHKLKCGKKTYERHRIFRVKEVRFQLQFDFLDELCNITRHHVVASWRTLCKTVCPIINSKCVVLFAVYKIGRFVLVNLAYGVFSFEFDKKKSLSGEKEEVWRLIVLEDDELGVLCLRRCLRVLFFSNVPIVS